MLDSGDKPAFLSVRRDYQQSYIPNPITTQYPITFSELFSEDHQKLGSEELKLHCNSVLPSLDLTEVEVSQVEQDTRKQRNCKLWHNFRIGRLTASRMKRICSSKLSKPSISLIRDICYPKNNTFSCAAMKWGCDNEAKARDEYFSKVQKDHFNMTIEDSGLVLNTDYPYLGVSPDGIYCDCCGKGIVEVKCPYKLKGTQIEKENAILKDTCLTYTDGVLQLCRAHDYYYQVPTQIFLCKVDYADFIVWTGEDIFVERIEPDLNLWSQILLKSKDFFENVIIFELVAKKFTNAVLLKLKTDDNICTPADTAELFCICQKPEALPMIQCENDNCKYVWFHFKCVGIKQPPKGKWFCKSCRDSIKN